MVTIRHQQTGFTLIEVLAFIVVSSLLMSTVLMGAIIALRNVPTVRQQWIAISQARACMENYVGQRLQNGYAALACPSTSNSCASPAGFNTTVTISCTSWNADVNYKTITVTVGGLASATLSYQIGNFL